MLGVFTMDNWIIIVIFIVAIGLVIGNFSMVQKNAETPLREKSLNDLQETLPRSNKTDHKMPTIASNRPIELKERSDLAIEIDEIEKQSAIKNSTDKI